jgi:hypothetical protein
MGRTRNQRKLGTTFAATITPSRTGFRATETAISGIGLPSIAPGPHDVQRNGLIAVGHHAKPLPSPCLAEVYPNRTGEGETVSVSQEGAWESVERLPGPGLQAYETGAHAWCARETRTF